MMKNKKVIVFLESGFFFPLLIWENGAFGAPVRTPGGLGRPDLYPKMTPGNTLFNEPSFVDLS